MTQTREFLTQDQLINQCPPVAFNKATRKGVSDKYVPFRTLDVIQDLDTLGWKPVSSAMRGAGHGQFSKHEVVLQHPSLKFNIGDDRVDPTLTVFNSYDGLASLKFMAGLFRMICSNGMVVPMTLFGQSLGKSVRVRHIHYSMDRLKQTIRETAHTMEKSLELVGELSDRTLTEDEMREFAKHAYLTRHKVQKEDIEKMLKAIPDETIDSLLFVERPQDDGNQAWRVFNRVQEKIIKGGYSSMVISPEGEIVNQTRQARALGGFERKTDVNMKLFQALTSTLDIETVN